MREIEKVGEEEESVEQVEGEAGREDRENEEVKRGFVKERGDR